MIFNGHSHVTGEKGFLLPEGHIKLIIKQKKMFKKKRTENSVCELKDEIFNSRIGREAESGIGVRINPGGCRAVEGIIEEV